MKNIFIKYFIMASLFSLAIQSCDSHYEKEPLNYRTDSHTWEKDDSIGRYPVQVLYSVYDKVTRGYLRVDGNFLDATTDDAVGISPDAGVNKMRLGRVGPGSHHELGLWSDFYVGIRRANNFINNSNRIQLSVANEKLRSEWVAEARFLRAFYYFELVKRWGGVPIVEDAEFQLNENNEMSRNSIEECFDYILKELDLCYDDLIDATDLSPVMIGRVNKGAVLGLRSRIRLYMASPLYALSSWEIAAKTSKEIIDMNIFSLEESYKDLFNKVEGNKESLAMFLNQRSSSLDQYNTPVGYSSQLYQGYGRTNPTQNFVDAFLMNNGLAISDPNSDYDPQKPYDNRDPRLAVSVFYNGSRWLKREVEIFEGGKDKPNTYKYPQTKTGYYLKKFLGKHEEAGNIEATNHPFILFRYAEILLNYAEALNESDGDRSEIEKSLIAIRKRAGIIPGDDSRYGLPTSYTKEEMREIIRNERRIELSFEEHRYFDIRRWKIADQVMNSPLRGVIITKLDNSNLNFDSKIIFDETNFDDKMYWHPIPRSEFSGNKNMKQNPGWDY